MRSGAVGGGRLPARHRTDAPASVPYVRRRITRASASLDATINGDRIMDADSESRRKLLRQVKRGRRTGAIQWTRLFVMLASAAELFNVVVDVHQGKGDFTLLADAIVMVFILAMAAIGLGILEMNERLAALVALIGEEKLLQSKE